MTKKIACCIWALRLPETELLREVSRLGFTWIDIQPGHLRTMESRLLAQELGLRVSCVGVTFGLPAGIALDSEDRAARQASEKHVRGAIEHAADVDADTAYLVPGKDARGQALERYAESLTRLADFAGEKGLKLALEHFPGTALSTAARTLEFIREMNHANVYLLYDSGHIQISGEDPATVIQNAGDRLGYVHLDDNDGIDDLHLSLLDGLMTEESLAATIQALTSSGYQGALSLELNVNLKRPAAALSESRDILLRATHQAGRRLS